MLSFFLNVGHINVQSIRANNGSKFDEILQILQGGFLDVVGVSETWLKSYITNKMIHIPGYKIVRNDRKNIRGGGVALYISSPLHYKIIDKSPENACIEYLLIEINLSHTKVMAGVVYRPNGDITTSLNEVFSNYIPKYEYIIVMGDFNLNQMNPLVSSDCNAFFNSFNLNILHNYKPTHFDVHNNSHSLIDFFIISSNLTSSFSDQFSVPSISKHSFIYHSFDIQMNRDPITIRTRNLKSINVNLLTEDANNSDFTEIYRTNDVNIQLEVLNNVVLNLLNIHAPIKTIVIKNKKKYNEWYTREIETAKIIRNLAFKSYRENPIPERWKTYCRHRNKVTNMIKKAKITYASSYYSADQPNHELWKKSNL